MRGENAARNSLRRGGDLEYEKQALHPLQESRRIVHGAEDARRN